MKIRFMFCALVTLAAIFSLPLTTAAQSLPDYRSFPLTSSAASLKPKANFRVAWRNLSTHVKDHGEWISEMVAFSDFQKVEPAQYPIQNRVEKERHFLFIPLAPKLMQLVETLLPCDDGSTPTPGEGLCHDGTVPERVPASRLKY